MKKLVECVPNFSEGRDKQKIQDIIDHILMIEGVTILDVDSGEDTNRTVVTIVGEPKPIKEAAFQGIKRAAEILDMSQHIGTHPRIGATDVCPFIPISGLSENECIELSKNVAERVGSELKIPVFLYEKSAINADRKKLPDIRKGEYEGLEKKLNDPNWQPDYGPSELHLKAGATVIGCRGFLIAYNINLNTKDHRLATDIAFELREAGRSKRIPNPYSKNLLDGEIVRSKDGKPVKIPGMFKDVKGIGWYVETFQRAQISINFNNYKISTIHDVFDSACKLAEDRGVRVTGSELVGLIPLEAMVMAGKYYLRKQNRSVGVPINDIIECAVQSLGLNDVAPFHPKEKIIDYAVEKDLDTLISMTCKDFIDELSTNSPAPGGGSVSALAGALGASLSSMVAILTHEKKEMLDIKPEMDKIGIEAQLLKDQLTNMVDEDTIAFKNVMSSSRLPSTTEDEKKHKKKSLEAANKYAIEVPMKTAELCFEVLVLSKNLVEKGNPNSVTDVGVASEIAFAGLRGACMNVEINLNNISDSNYRKNFQSKINKIIIKAGKLRSEIYDQTMSVLH